jgi:hypothetical protein
MSNLKLAAIAALALMLGGFGGRHLQSALDAEKIRGIETQARELEGHARSLSQSLEGLEGVMRDVPTTVIADSGRLYPSEIDLNEFVKNLFEDDPTAEQVCFGREFFDLPKIREHTPDE